MYSIKELLDGYAKKQFSPVEITEQYIERAKQQEDLNAFILITEEIAHKQAKIAETKWQLGLAGKLEGIPLSYKDNIHTKGVTSTSGSKIDENFVPEKDAQMIHTMNKEGAVMVGKNNMHEFAFGITNNNPFYGPAKNPWNTELSPGGSSGGSAVSVLANSSVASLGTDTGGSVRIPAASCGLVGLKPTYGVLSGEGLTPISQSLDHPGPITKNVTDSIIMMEALTNRNYSLIDPHAEDLKGIKIGVPNQFFNEKIDKVVLDEYNKTLQKLINLGAHLVYVDMPYTDESIALTFTLAIAEGGYTHRNRMAQMKDYGVDVAGVMEASKSILSSQYIDAVHRQTEISDACEQLLQKVDFLVTPTIPAQPQKIGQDSIMIEGEEEEPLFDCMIRYASYFNLTGHPAISLPVSLVNNIPVGVQFVSGKHKERQLLSMAKIFEQAYVTTFYKIRDEKFNK